MFRAFLTASVVALALVLLIVVSHAQTTTTATIKSRPKHPPAITSIIQPSSQPQFGGQLPGLTDAQKLNFSLGKAQFDSPEEVDEGLGPIFNAQSCAACHTQPLTNGTPTSGGASAITETRFGTSTGTFDLLHQADIVPIVQDLVPNNATQVAHRKTTPLFGLGLIEAIPDDTIRAGAGPKGDGVSGRVAIVSDPVPGATQQRVGRFGWKCQQATVDAFSGDAYANEMGIANRVFPLDFAPHIPNGQTILEQVNRSNGFTNSGPNPQLNQDPPENVNLPFNKDTNKDDVERFADFMRMLAPPPVKALSAQALQGQTLFRNVNCVACHTPNFKTGASSIAALNLQNAPLYSDLLLHQMGDLGDGIVQAAARANEMRTAPLWGLRARSPFLHDGRASTVKEAILAHDGEAKVIRDRFAALPDAAQQAIMAFLNSI